MCIICVQIIRERITPREGLEGFKEAVEPVGMPGVVVDGHAAEILNADRRGDMKEFKRLIDEGYRKERWL